MKSWFTFLICCSLIAPQIAAQDELSQLEEQLFRTHDTARVNVLNKLSWSYRNSNTKKALYYANQATKISSRLHYWRGLAYSWKNTGAIYSVTGDYPAAKTALKKSLQQFSELNNHIETGNVWNLTGLLYWETGNYDSALVCYNQAYTYFHKIGDEEGKSIIYSNRAIILYEQGNYDEALANNIKALKIAEQDNNLFTQANVHTNIGIIYSAIGNYPKALKHQKIALRLEKGTGNHSDAAKSYTNIGVAYFHLGKLDKSLYYHQKALTLYRKLGEQKGIAHSLLNIGSIWQEYNNHAAARDCFRHGLQLKRHIGDQNGEIIALTYLGRLYLKENNFREANRYLESAYKKAFRLKLLFYQVETSLMLAQIADLNGDSDNAMHFYKIYTVANNSLLREKSSNHLTDLQIGLATREKQALINHLKQQAAQSRSRQRIFLSGGIVLLLLIVPLFIRLRKRYRREKTQLETELEEKRSALLLFTQQLLEKRSGETPDKDPHNVSAEPIEEEERLETLQQLSNARLITEEDWETFKKLFNNVYPFFIVRLRQSNPDITPAELRLSTLTVLNLTTREMAGMLGISPDSVKKARQRLRKKLELSSNDNLDERLKGLTQED